MPRLVRLALVGVLVTYALIVLGGITRVTGSGMGSADDWPRCHGKWHPPLETIAIIEYLHRAVAAALGLLVVAIVVIAIRAPGLRRGTRGLAAGALGLIVVQGLLGAVTVWRELPASIVTAHLGTSMVFLATMLLLTWRSAVDLGSPDWLAKMAAGPPASPPWLSRTAAIAATAVFAVILTGGSISTSGAALACDAWPQCMGDAFIPDRTSRYTWLNLTHRAASASAAVVVVGLAIVAVRRSVPKSAQRVTSLAAAAIVLQIALGAAYVLTDGSRWLSAAHLATATLLWAMLFSLAVLTIPPVEKPAVSASAAQDGSGRALPRTRHPERAARTHAP
jgi:heme A synthase